MDIKAIFKWIRDNDPDSCISYNYNELDCEELPEELMTEECLNYFYYEHINWCGCGSPDDAVACICKYLQCVNERNYEERKIKFKNNFGCSSVHDNHLLLCLAYSMDSLKVTEHGSSIGGAWLTDIGKMVLFVLEKSIYYNINL